MNWKEIFKNDITDLLWDIFVKTAGIILLMAVLISMIAKLLIPVAKDLLRGLGLIQ